MSVRQKRVQKILEIRERRLDQTASQLIRARELAEQAERALAEQKRRTEEALRERTELASREVTASAPRVPRVSCKRRRTWSEWPAPTSRRSKRCGRTCSRPR
jgi:hypothetical protein